MVQAQNYLEAQESDERIWVSLNRSGDSDHKNFFNREAEHGSKEKQVGCQDIYMFTEIMT